MFFGLIVSDSLVHPDIFIIFHQNDCKMKIDLHFGWCSHSPLFFNPLHNLSILSILICNGHLHTVKYPFQ